MNQIYTVHKTFLDGTLKGMAITEQTSVSFQLGKTYGGGWTGPRYKITAVETTVVTPADQPPASPPTIQTTTT
jgi:hypothetical protein